MFARMSRYNPAARGIRSPPRIRPTAQNGRWRYVSSSTDSSSGRGIELSSGLLIRGFGGRVPGGAPVLTWGYTYLRSPEKAVLGRAGSMFARELGPGGARLVTFGRAPGT